MIHIRVNEKVQKYIQTCLLCPFRGLVDLLQILNHDRLPLGFSYETYPHDVRVWYGDRDERIAENAVRWMEHTMGPDKCQVQVVKGAEHALMFKSGVVIEVLEHLTQFWRDCE